ncbi:cytochrome P450 [Obba rivulosa]|uniref:Cytochrome P450 n=1 Tax=Obba rivulosa TaxID=1052685 RepID=A0A8E2APS6_9APHY|nr:cytochrome P450 [Obba rivulosa]
MLQSIALSLLIAVLAILLWRKYANASANVYQSRPLPPGPTPLPVIGNVLDVPSVTPWKTYAQWADRYGGIVFMRVFGQPIMIINSLEVAVDLLEKRSSNYSDRLRNPEMITLMGWDWNTATMEYGQKWRRHRRSFHQYFNQAAVHAYEPQTYKSAQKLLKCLYHDPTHFAHHIRYVLGANILSIAYGFEIAEKDDKHIEVAEMAMHALSEGLIPGTFWVDFLPFLKYIPAWVPGAGFQKKAAEWKESVIAMKEMPWANAIKDSSSPSVAARLWEGITHLDGEAFAEEEEIAKNVAGVAYVGGVDTTVSTLHSFIQAMILYPEVQTRAQAELARVVGPDRLPEFSDKDSLPYIGAVCKEAMRWQPVVPLSVAHRCLADDEYKGYSIPEGTLLIQNAWAILHDPEEYENPEHFVPERFLKDGELNPEVRDPGVAAFGAGRRICPGRYFSDLVLFINVACILHTFDVTPAFDAQGQAIKVEPEMSTGLLSHPLPFKCTIKPRSYLAETLILGDSTVKA